jgi:hypothetical protein
LVVFLSLVWKFDDFSWGNTREVEQDSKSTKTENSDDYDFDPSAIQLRQFKAFLHDNRYMMVDEHHLLEGSSACT